MKIINPEVENKTIFKMDNTKPIEKVPIPNVEKEIKASYVSHFNNRMVLSDQAKDALHERFLLVLEENPNTLMLFCISGNIRQQLTYLLIVPINLKLAIIVEITTLTFISSLEGDSRVYGRR